MTCEHLRSLECAILSAGLKETFRGQAWSNNCREWVYFDGYIDPIAVREHFALPDCVKEHSHRGTHDGQESGFVCSQCWDAVIGAYEPRAGLPIFPFCRFAPNR
ncbi:MAG TPA: hypothetical protein VKH81_06465 [Candidatus Angelobacter sp.]|nr:hypothetical protein [Candidatus Angelobacter sp.]